MSMRDLVIDELILRRRHDYDYSNGMQAALEKARQEDEEYKATLLNVSDTDLLFDLLEVVGERVREEAKEHGAFYRSEL